MNYKLPERDTVWGLLLDNYFENNIKNQREKLLNRADIYGLHFQSDGATIKDMPILNILSGGFTYLYQSKILWAVQVTSQAVTRIMQFFAEVFFDPMNEHDPEEKLMELHIFDWVSVCIKAQKYLRLSIPYCHVLLEQIIPAIIFKRVGIYWRIN